MEDILEAAKAVRRFTDGISLEAFKANEEKYEAVNRKFEIIGEAARRLSPEARNLLPEIPWKLITAMRNILIHDYDDVHLCRMEYRAAGHSAFDCQIGILSGRQSAAGNLKPFLKVYEAQ